MCKFEKYKNSAGLHKSGYVAFRNSKTGRAALDFWVERCKELCSAIPMRGTYIDQIYIDWLPAHFSGVYSSEHIGVNAGPWSIDGHRVIVRDANVFLDDEPLLIYHVQGMRIYGPRLYDLYAGPHKLPKAAVQHIYRPYIRALRDAHREVCAVQSGYDVGIRPFWTQPKTIYHQIRRKIVGTNNLTIA